MMKTITKSVVALLACVLLFPATTFAHDWDDSYDSNNDGSTHTHHRYCYDCGEEYSVVESCSWKYEGRDCSEWSDTKHRIETYYSCPLCYADKTVTTYASHSNAWVRYGNNFWYECKGCGAAPKFNGFSLIDCNDSDNISIKKNKKYSYFMYGFHKKYNKVKSIKRSKKKVCTVKRKGSKLIIKGKKKGKCKVTVTMRSGAKYVLKVRVR